MERNAHRWIRVILEKLLAQREEALMLVKETDTQISACRVVLRLSGAEEDGLPATVDGHGRIRAVDLQGMDITDALILFAERNDGIVSTYEVRPVLMEAGLLKGDPRAASTRLYEALVNSECFESLPQRGRWEVLPEKVKERQKAKAEEARRLLMGGNPALLVAHEYAHLHIGGDFNPHPPHLRVPSLAAE